MEFGKKIAKLKHKPFKEWTDADKEVWKINIQAQNERFEHLFGKKPIKESGKK